MSREKDHHVVSALGRVGSENFPDFFGEDFDEFWVSGPAVDDRPFNLSVAVELFGKFPELVEGGAGGRARVLRVLCEGYCASNAVGEELLVGVVGKGVSVAECDVGTVRGGGGVDLVEKFTGAGGLNFGPFADRRAAADYIVFWEVLETIRMKMR